MNTITTKITKEFSWADASPLTLKVGDEITTTLKDGREAVFVVLDTGVIGLKNCLDRHYMNKEWTNAGGWQASDMRAWLNSEVFALLPDDLQAIIKPRKLGWNDNTFEDMLWLFSEVEIFGEHDWTEKEPDRGKQFKYFMDPANRVKCDETGDPCWWWERSPFASDSNAFCCVDSVGGAGSSIASYSRGVCFGFYI